MVAVESIVHHLDNKKSVCAAFLDLRKAFDSLDHCILLTRLSSLGLSNVVLRWFQDYNRTHRVKSNQQFSYWAQMEAGIPQGSALGPLLFLIYVNTLPSVVNGSLLLQYADDTTLVCTARSCCKCDESTTNLIHDWLVKHRMSLNVQKSWVLWFHIGRQKKQLAAISKYLYQ